MWSVSGRVAKQMWIQTLEELKAKMEMAIISTWGGIFGFLTKKKHKQMGRGEPAWRAASPPMRRVLTWPEMIPEAFPTVHDTKHQNPFRSRRLLAALAQWHNIITRRLRVDCCDLSENIWPDHKLFCALSVNLNMFWDTFFISTTMLSCLKDISVN